jgi:hypothetical protein
MKVLINTVVIKVIENVKKRILMSQCYENLVFNIKGVEWTTQRGKE